MYYVFVLFADFHCFAEKDNKFDLISVN